MADNSQKSPEKVETIISLEVNFVGGGGKYVLYISVGSPNNPDFKPDKICKILVIDEENSVTKIQPDEFGYCEYTVTEFTTKRKKVIVRVLDTIGNKQVDKTITLRGPKKMHPKVNWDAGFLANLFPDKGKGLLNLIIFAFFLFVIPIVALTSGWWFLGSLLLLIAIVATTLHCSPTTQLRTQSGMGALFYRISTDNNYRFWVLIVCALITLILGMKYGGGEPVFISVFRSSTSWLIKPIYTEQVQKIQNGFVSGVNESNRTIQDKKMLLQQFRNDPAYTLRAGRLEKESKQQYNERASNYMTYDLFALDGEIAELLNSANQRKDDVQTEGAEWSRKGKGWFFWKLFLVLFMMALIYFPFAFADEAADFFDDLAEKFKTWWERQGETQAAAESAPLSTPGGFLTRVGEIAGVDMAMEVLYKMAKGFAEYLRR